MPQPIIEVKNLSFRYERTPILENVQLSVLPGEFIGIFGPNGGGKTTFLKLLMGFLRPTEGTIHLFGTSPQTACCKLGYVPQISRYDKQFPLSVLDLVLMGCLSEASWWGGYSSKAKRKAEEALDKVGLLEKKHVAFGTLSGGQAQRALIARALASEPELLLLDEPTASVDPEAEEEIYNLLVQLKGSITIIMVTHDLQSILDKADRLLCIHRQLTSLPPSAVCQHFALGLYHPARPS